MNKKDKRREQILKASFEAVAHKGFSEVTLQDIASYAEVSKGVTNYYFKNKEDVLSHLLYWITTKIHENEKTAINKETDAINKLKAYVNSAFASPDKNRKFYQVYLEFLAQANNNKKFRDINYLFYQNCWKLGREIVQVGQEEGVFSIKVDIEKAAISIRSIIDGCLIQWMMRNDDTLHSFYKNNCFDIIKRYLTNPELHD